jgi:hypothetical protein
MSNSCANCSFYVSGTCRIDPPNVLNGVDYAWPRCQPTDWCASWNVWPGNPPPTGLSSICTSGTAVPSGGNNGDFYVLYRFKTAGLLDICQVYQKQSGTWVVIITIVYTTP